MCSKGKLGSRKRFLRFAVWILGAKCAFAGSTPLPSYQRPLGVLPPAAEGVKVVENLGGNVDLDLTFTDETGQRVPLRKYFQQGRPVILDLVYYRCPTLCNLILNGQTQVMREIPWTPGKEYEIVTISIDPRERPEVARDKKATHLNAYGKPAPGWHFLTDPDGNAKKLAEQVGYHYRYDKFQDQYVHPASIQILTPSGKVARYLYGIRFRARDVRFALAEASEGRMTLTIDKLLLLCYHYDPEANSYVMFATNFMKFGGVLSVLLLGFFILRVSRLERRREGL